MAIVDLGIARGNRHAFATSLRPARTFCVYAAICLAGFVFVPAPETEGRMLKKIGRR